MTTIVEKVEAIFDPKCIVTRMNKQGCRVTLKGMSCQHIIVDLDKLSSILKHKSRCDYLFFTAIDTNSEWFIPLEIKKGKLHATEAKRQLQAGAQIADPLVPRNQVVNFRPAVAVGCVPRAEILKLRNRNNRVRFRNQISHIKLLKCGDSIARALNTK